MRFLRLLLASVAFAATAGGAYAVEPKNGTVRRISSTAI